MTSMLPKRFAAAALGAALLGAGCGNDAADETKASAVPKAKWIAQSKAMCRRLDEETDKRAKQFFAQKGASELGFVHEVVAPGVDRWGDELSAGGAPEGQEDQVERLIDIAHAVAEQFRTAKRAAEFKGAPGTETRRLFDEGKRLATQLGVQAPCGDGSG